MKIPVVILALIIIELFSCDAQFSRQTTTKNMTNTTPSNHHPEEQKSASIISQLSGSWRHKEDSLASIFIKGKTWTFEYEGKNLSKKDIYQISIVAHLPQFVNDSMASDYLMLTNTKDTLYYEILGLSDSTLSLMYFPNGRIHVYDKR